MRKHLFVSCALVALVVGLFTAGAAAQGGPDPAQIAQECIQDLAARATARAEKNAAIAANCVEKIGELLEAGEVQQAFHVGGHCIHRIRVRSHLTTDFIRFRSHQCQHLLIFLGAPQLAHVVKEAGMQAVHLVKMSRVQAVTAIKDALPDP